MTNLLALKLCAIYIFYIVWAVSVYDFFQCWLKWRKAKKLKFFCMDILLVSLLGMGFTAVLIKTGGIFRWYVLGAVGVGIIIYYALAAKPLGWVYRHIFAIAAYLWQCLTIPTRKLAVFIKKYYKKYTKKFRKIHQTYGNLPMNDV